MSDAQAPADTGSIAAVTETETPLRPHSHFKNNSDAETPISEYCGGYSLRFLYKCPALPEGWCDP